MLYCNDICCGAVLQHRFQDAYEGYGAALRIDESNISMTSKLLCNRAIAALKLQRFEHAVQDASAALFFNPQYAKAYATRAAAHVELDRYGEAEKDYEHAIELEPWERQHGLQLSQVKMKLSQQREKDDGDKGKGKAQGKAVKK